MQNKHKYLVDQVDSKMGQVIGSVQFSMGLTDPYRSNYMIDKKCGST